MARRQHSYTLPAERLTSNSNASQEHGSAPKHANRTGHTNVKTQTRRNFNTIAFYTQKPLHSFFNRESFYTYFLIHRTPFLHTQRQLHREFVAQRGPYTEKVAQIFFTQRTFSHRFSYTERFLHTEASARRSFYTTKFLLRKPFLHTEVLTHRSFCTAQFLHREAFTRRS